MQAVWLSNLNPASIWNQQSPILYFPNAKRLLSSPLPLKRKTQTNFILNMCALTVKLSLTESVSVFEEERRRYWEMHKRDCLFDDKPLPAILTNLDGCDLSEMLVRRGASLSDYQFR